ncbi:MULTISPECIES: SMI1/KNR4 family protein [Streptomyces]|nr:SMI1/KNR4 family protein [Streptomyces viridochromogenes]
MDRVESLTDCISLIRGEGGDDVDWVAVQEFYGVEFPADYKKFVSRFGGGTIDGRVGIMVPIAVDDEMVRKVYRLPESIRVDPGMSGWVDARNLGLERDILVWGDTDSADLLGWVTNESDPDSWPIVVYSRVNAAWSVYECFMSEFIFRLLVGDFGECPISDTSLMRSTTAEFLRDREEERLLDMGIYPWDD